MAWQSPVTNSKKRADTKDKGKKQVFSGEYVLGRHEKGLYNTTKFPLILWVCTQPEPAPETQVGVNAAFTQDPKRSTMRGWERHHSIKLIYQK